MKQLKITLIYLVTIICTMHSIKLHAQDTSIADSIRDQNPQTLDKISKSLILVDKTNFVDRPWAGSQLLQFKNIDPQTMKNHPDWKQAGECFELSAFPRSKDKEAGENPSVITFHDGSKINLLELLENAGKSILGEMHIKNYGYEIPLLPKSLNVGQLLSIQAHPEGSPELYVVLKAEPGASIFLGFKQNMPNINRFKHVLEFGRSNQEKLLSYLCENTDQANFYQILVKYFARRQSIENISELFVQIKDYVRPEIKEKKVIFLLQELQSNYCKVLDMLNNIEVHEGDIIYNAYCKGPEGLPCSEIHALGNPDNKELLVIEIRKPGVTYRVWDNLRFPMRNLDIEKGLSEVNIKATRPENFRITPTKAEDDGIYNVVENQFFNVKKISLSVNQEVKLNTNSKPGILISTSGTSNITSKDSNGTFEESLGQMAQGQTALVPASIGEYKIKPKTDKAELLLVTLVYK